LQERNFLRDQSGMRLQLLTLDHLVQLLDPKLYLHLQKVDSTNFFFFFRMLLVWYKREFEWLDVLRLWEGLWTDYLSSNFHLFIAVAILEKHRDVIIEHLKGFDEVLKYGTYSSWFGMSPVADYCSERTIQHNRSRIDHDPRRGSLPPLSTHSRDDRQETQLPHAERTTTAPGRARGQPTYACFFVVRYGCQAAKTGHGRRSGEGHRCRKEGGGPERKGH